MKPNWRTTLRIFVTGAGDEDHEILPAVFLALAMLDREIQEKWTAFAASIASRLGRMPCLDTVLLYIGVREAGCPWKAFTEKEEQSLREVAVCTIMTPHKYYELIWVDDTGWPHFRQLRPFSIVGEEDTLITNIIRYTEKHRLL